jgi:hypothetical protein
MGPEERERLFRSSNKRIDQLEAKHKMGIRLTRKECNDLRHCVARLGVIARESWIAAGCPEDPGFESLRQPIKLSPLPKSMRLLDLTDSSVMKNN